jgi:hypothetical protein
MISHDRKYHTDNICNRNNDELALEHYQLVSNDIHICTDDAML